MQQMKELALHVTAISLLLAGTAAAADLRRPAPVKAPAPAPVVTYNWTGCYVGAGGGYGMFNQDTTAFETPGGTPFPGPTVGGRGWFGTVQVGCDYQVGANIVIGAFADYDFGSIKGDLAVFSLVGEEKLKSSWAAGGRIGWLPFPQLMTFVSGGYTEARFDEVNFVGSANNDTLAKHTYSGWFIGAGYEYAIGWLPGLYWKSEYRFADYGTDNVLILENGSPSGGSIDSHKYVHKVRSELVWRFNFGGPVVARY
jgi:outer membrane immunogenic protein